LAVAVAMAVAVARLELWPQQAAPHHRVDRDGGCERGGAGGESEEHQRHEAG